MAESANPIVNRFFNYSRQPVARQLALLLGLAASIALGIGLVQWGFAPAYKPLYGSMNGENTNGVISALEANGFDYRLDPRTGMVAVPASELHRARLALASDGYPRGEGLGFETLYEEQELGVSSFMEQARYHRALEQELTRTISAMDGVRAARVHLAMAKQSAFLRQREKPAASVMLQLLSGQTLSDRQVAGILHLVSSSVPNLEPEQVSVVGQRGRLLSRKAVDDGLGYTQEQYRLAQELEQRYSQRIVDIIEPILGPGRVRAQVAADIDFTRVERTSEQYAPETVVRSEQTAEERGSLLDTGGVPGTLANQPPPDAQVQAAPPGNPANPEDPALAVEELQPVSRRVTRNYEMDKTISHVREQPGNLRRLSVAVVVDYIEGEGEDGGDGRVPLGEERLEEIRALVREAVGFDAERGDTVSVINASFAPPPELAPLEEPSFLDAEWPWRVGRGVLAASALAALIFVVLRPLMKFSAAPLPAALPAAGGQQALLAEERAGELGDDRVTLGGQGAGGGYQQQLQMARNLAEGEPQRAAQVVRGWVSADG